MRTMHMTDQEFEQFVATHPVSGGKGSDSAKAVRDQEFAMQKQAFDKQMQMMNTLQGAYSKYLGGQIGFDPAMKAAMTSQFLNSNAQTYNQAGQQVRQALGARGNLGGNPVGGDYARGLSNLLGARAGSQSQGLLGIQEQNAQLANQNMWNAGNILSGNAAALTGTQGVSANAMSNALNQFMHAEQSGFGGNFMSAFGSTIGQGIGNFALGGLGKVGGGLFG